MNIACVGNYPPRECGIATFTHNLIEAIKTNPDSDKNIDSITIVAMNDNDMTYDYPDEVKFTIKQQHQRDYLEAAEFINFSDADICLLQHEFGIFGGHNGIYILPLLNRLKIPVIVTLHTVLKNPSYNEKAIIQQFGKEASAIVVMSRRAIDFLVDIYQVPSDKIKLIEHGIPDFCYPEVKRYKKKFHLDGKKLLFTFGLLSRNKGIETVIKALPKVIEKHPDTVYIVLGKTHPNVLRHTGEEYRTFLTRLVEKNDLRPYVYFYDTFLNQSELWEYLCATDIYITPYLNEAQITSGTLSYAVGAGAAVISTPYWHAQELLADGRGLFFNFNDSNKLTEILLDLLDSPAKLRELRIKAHAYGKRMIWPTIGSKYIDLAQEIMEKRPKAIEKALEKPVINPLVMPHFNLEHVQRLTDDAGMIQHAKFHVPNLKEGYCLDDNSRALLMVLMAHQQKKMKEGLDLMTIYLGYINYMQNEDGSFRNLLSYDKKFLDDAGTDDSFGRTIWALGYLIRYAPNDAFFQLGKEMFTKAYPHICRLKSLRAVAYCIVGICHYLYHFQSDETMRRMLQELISKMKIAYQHHRTNDWKWFETKLTYVNGLLPLALYDYYQSMQDETLLHLAQEATAFLETIYFPEDYLSLVGNDGWYEQNNECSRFAQQPVDAMMAVLLFYKAYLVTRNKHYLERTFSAFMWFLGENGLMIPLYDFETHGCCDGLEKYEVNRNQGAESILAYLISHLTVLSAHELEAKK